MLRNLKQNSLFNKIWSAYRAAQLHNDYTKRRDYYFNLCKSDNITYQEVDVIQSIRNRLSSRGYSPPKKQIGEIRTFAFIPQYSWHHHLLPHLELLGPVHLFDFTSLGYYPEEFEATKKWDKKRIQRRKSMLDNALSVFYEMHQKFNFDWFFCYGGGHKVSSHFIDQIINSTGIPTVNMTFDDKQGWTGPFVGDHCAGAKDITRHFDMFATSSRVTCDWHLVEGGRAIYMPEGFNDNYFKPSNMKKNIKVSFVGQKYGFRESVIQYLSKHDIAVETYGAGWPNGKVDSIVDIFNRSIINLGMGGIGYSESITNVKGRDFEIPGTGGGVYLTSFNPDLALHYTIGEEILCYRNQEEMLEMIRYYLCHQDEANIISERGRQKSLSLHKWYHRYLRILRILGIIDA